MTDTTSRPSVSIFSAIDSNKANTHVLPSVFNSPIRLDLVQFVHKNMSKNTRQPYAVKTMAGHGYSAESWGPGRAVARIPRVSGGGTHKAGSGAFGNQCRGGHMFAPNKVWRKWHCKTNKQQKRYALCSALAATSITSLVQGRGHKIDKVPELPLVINTKDVQVHKTKDAINILEKFGCMDDVNKAKDSKKIRPGKGKSRNRRYKIKKGPLIVYKEDEGIVNAFRNLPGVELCHISRLNLLKLAPGSHLGRFVIWTSSAFERLDQIFGTRTIKSEINKFVLPHNVVTVSDVDRIIQSEQVQTVLKDLNLSKQTKVEKHNPLKNKQALEKIMPYELERKTKDNETNIKNRNKVKDKKITKQKNKKNRERKAKNNEWIAKTQEEINKKEIVEEEDDEESEEEDEDMDE